MNLNLDSVGNFFGLGGIVTKPHQPNVDIKALGEKKIFLTWEGNSRPHADDPTTASYNRTYTVIGIVIGVILIILQEFFLLLLIGSMLFVRYVLAKVPPEKITYTLSTHGITIDKDTYYWSELLQYFFTEYNGENILAVDIAGATVPRLFISFNKKDKQAIKDVLDQHLIYIENPPKSVLDRTYDSIMSKLSFK